MKLHIEKRLLFVFLLSIVVASLFFMLDLTKIEDENKIDHNNNNENETENPPIQIVEEIPIITPPIIEEIIDEPIIPDILEKVAFTNESLTDNLLKIAQKYNVIGMSIVVVKHNDVISSLSYGYQDKEKDIAFSVDSVMRIASVSELISTIGIMKLKEQSQLDLDEDISNYLSYKAVNLFFPEIPLTLRHLMTHTASLSDYHGYDKIIRNQIEYQPLFELINPKGKYYDGNFYRIKPGTKYEHSNFGGGIVGAVAAAVTEMDFNDFMNEILFDPLNLDASYLSTEISDASKIANIYKQNKLNYNITQMNAFAENLKDINPADNYRLSQGNLYISAIDMSRIMRMFLDYGSVDGKQIISEESVKEMLSSEPAGYIEKDVGYGLNVDIKKNLIEGRTLYGHQGRAYGATCEMFFDYTDKSGVIILINGSNESVNSENFSLVGETLIKEVYQNIIGQPEEITETEEHIIAED